LRSTLNDRRAFRKLAEYTPKRLAGNTQDQRIKRRDGVRRPYGLCQQRRFSYENTTSDETFGRRLLQRDLAFQYEKGAVRRIAAGKQPFSGAKAAPLAGKSEQLHRLARQSVERSGSREPANVAIERQHACLVQGSSL